MTSLLSLILTATLLQTLPSSKVIINGRSHELIWTIDDHPCKATYPMLLLLRQYRLKATFFVVTDSLYWYYKNPSYLHARLQWQRVKSIAKAGHVIGNHSHSHDLLCKKPYRYLVRFEVGRPQTLLLKATGKAPTLWRPPHGQTCRRLRRAVAHYKLRWVWWHVSDWRTGHHRMWQLIKQRSRRYPRTIILVHNNVVRFRKLLKLAYGNPQTKP